MGQNERTYVIHDASGGGSTGCEGRLVADDMARVSNRSADWPQNTAEAEET